MSWYDFIRRSAGELQPVEKEVLSAVADRLNAPARELFSAQLASVNKVQRHTQGKEVNLYRVEGGKPSFDDTLRFPLKRPEVRLASVSVGAPALVKPLRADVWLANGRVFSLHFDRPPRDVGPGEIQVISVRLLVDPMQPDEPVNPLDDVGRLRNWLGAIADRYQVQDAKEPPTAGQLESYVSQLDYRLPADLLDLFRITGGFRIDGCTVHGLLSLRALMLDQGEFMVVAETPSLAVLAIAREGPQGVIVYLHPDEARPKAMGDQFRSALESFLVENLSRSA